MGRNGAEEDDLVQEGRIHIWLSLSRGIHPSAEMIENRMKDWVRLLDPQNPVPYETLLPMEPVPGEGPSPVDRYVAAQDLG